MPARRWFRNLVARRSPRPAPRRFFARLWVEPLEDRLAPAVNPWLGGNADWTANPAINWGLHHVPVAGEQVQISNGATVTHSVNGTAGGDEVALLTVNGGSGLVLSGGSIMDDGALDDSGGSFQLAGGALVGAAVTSASNVTATGFSSTLTNVSIAGTLDMRAASATVRVSGALKLPGGVIHLGDAPANFQDQLLFLDAAPQTVDGAAGSPGTIVFGGYQQDGLVASAATTKLTLGANLTVTGASGKVEMGAATFDNLGKVIEDPSATGGSPFSTTMTLSGTNWTNHGTLGAQNGGTLSLAGTWSNAGTVSDNLSTVNLGGSFTTAGLGTFTGTFTAAAGAINLTGALDNTAPGAVLRVGGAPLAGNWFLAGGTVTGGAVQAASGSALIAVGTSTLVGVTLDGTGAGNSGSPLDMQTAFAVVKVSGNLTLKGAALRVGDLAANLQDQLLFVDAAPQTVDGAAGSPGKIVFGGYAQDGLVGSAATVKLTLGPNLTVTGAAGKIDSGAAPFDNQGKVIADPLAAGPNPFQTTITLSGAGWANHGTVGAQNGGALTLAGSWSNQGGTISTDATAASTVNLGGAFTTAGLGAFTRSGGVVNLTGVLNNAGATLTLDAAKGKWNLSGTVSGGTVQAAAGAGLVGAGTSTLVGVTLDGTGGSASPLDMQTAFAVVKVSGNLTLKGAVLRMGDLAANIVDQLQFVDAAQQTVDGVAASPGTIVFGGHPQNGLLGTAATTKLTLGPNLTVTGAAGRIDTGSAPFDNQGKVIADPAAAGPNPFATTITLNGAGWTNSGTVGARNGGTVTLSSPAGASWGGPGGTISTDAAAASTVNLGGTVKTADLGTFSRGGGAVNLTGVLDNAGATLTLDAGRGKWNLAFGTVSGGTVQAAAGAGLVGTTSAGTLVGVTLDGGGGNASPLDMQTASATVKVVGNLTLKGATLHLGDAAANFQDHLSFVESTIAADPTGATESGPTVTITTTAAHGLAVGQTVVVAGVGVAGYNGTFTIASVPSPTTFTYTDATTGLAASGGGTANSAQTVDGVAGSPGTIALGGTANDSLVASAATVKLIFGPNLTVTGAAGTIGTVGVPFDNQGKIIADPSATGPNPFQANLTLTGTNWTNHGTLGAQNGGLLTLAGSWSNNSVTSGTINVADAVSTIAGAAESGTTVTITTTAAHGLTVGRTVVIAGVGVAGYNGTFTITAVPSPTTFTYTAATGLAASGGGNATVTSTVNLGGSFATAGLGTFTRTGGTINLTGALDNTGATFRLGAAPLPGSWNLAGNAKVTGGTIQAAGTSALIVADGISTNLTNVMLDGTGGNNVSPLDMQTNNSTVNMSGNLTLKGATLRLGKTDGSTSGKLIFVDGAPQTIDGAAGSPGTVVFGANGNNGLFSNANVASVVTLGANLTITGAVGQVTSTVAFDNKGVITADPAAVGLASGTITLNGTAWTNHGTIQAQNGGTVVAQGTVSNFAAGTLTGGTWKVFANSTLRLIGGNITTNAANITLSGANSNFYSDSGGTNTDALANFAANAAAGNFTLAGGRNLTAPGAFTNAGAMTVDATGAASTFTAIGVYTQTGGATTLVAGGALVSTAVVVGNGAAVSIQAGTLQGTGAVTGNVAVANGATLSPGTAAAAGTIAITGNLTMNAGSTFTEKLTGPNTTNPVGGTDFDQVGVSGTVTLNNPTLNGIRTTAYVPDNGVAFKVINNTGGAAITGTFNGLAEGSTDTINPAGGGVFFDVTYKGGAGNDGVLTVLTPTTVYVDDTWAGTPIGSDPANDPVVNLAFSYNAFGDLQSAINRLAVGGTMVVFGGTYAAAVNVNKSLAPIQTALNATTPGQALVTLNGPLTLGTNTTFSTTTADLTVAGQVGGGGNLSKIGAGTLTLANAGNNYTGTTSVSGGTLSISSDGDLGAAPAAPLANSLTLAGGTLQVTAAINPLNANRGITLGAGGGTIQTAGGNLFVNGALTGGTGLTKTGGGDLFLQNSGALGGPGPINVSQGRLLFNSQNALGTGPVNVAAGATLDYFGGSALALANAVTFAGGANVASRAAPLTLPASAVLPTAGTMIFNNDDQATAPVVVQANDTLTGNLTAQVGGGNPNVGAVTWAGVIGGNGGLTKTQAGTLALANNANSYSGATTISGGALQVSADADLGNAANAVVFNGGTLQATGAFSSGRNVTLNAGGGTIDTNGNNLTLAAPGVIGGVGRLIKAGAGTLTLTGSNTYSGGTTVNAGSLQVSADANLGATAGGATVNAATLEVSGTYTSSRGLTLGDPASTVQVDAGQALTLSTPVGGVGGLTKAGGGSLTLNGANTYAGATTVNAGALFVNGSTASAAAVTVNSGGTLGGSASLGGPLTVNSGGTVSPGTGSIPGKLAIAGSYTQNAGATLNVKVRGKTTPGIDYDTLSAAGAANLNGTLNVTVVNGFPPATGDSYQIMAFASRAGDFATRNGFVLGKALYIAEQFNATNLSLVVNPATLKYQTQPANPAAAGQSFPVQVQVVDAGGNLLSTDNVDQVTLTLNQNTFADGTTSKTQSVVNGVASFTLTINTAAVGYQLSAGGNGFAGALSNTFVVNAATTHFSVSAPASATAGAAFTFTVTALDASNHTVTGYGGTAHFTSTDGAAILPADSTLTNGVGTFSATCKTAGSQTLTAADAVTSSITGSSGAIAVSPAAASHFAVSAPAGAVVGQAFSFTVTAQDPFNNTATGYAGTVHFTSSDGAASLPADSTLTNGSGTFGGTLNTAGNQTLTATDKANAGLTGTSNAINVSSASVHFAISAPASAVAGLAFSFTVTALDAGNHTITGYAGTVHFTSSDGAAGLPANSTLTNGTGSFKATLKTAGSQTLTATDTAKSSFTGPSNAIQVSAAAATHFAAGAPAAATAGVAFSFTVTALDAFNNTATGYGGTVHFSSSDGQAVLPNNSTLTSGVGSFSATLKTAGSQTLTAADTVTSSITGSSNAVAVNPAAATHFTVSAPSTATAGSAFSFTVTAQDPFNNTATGYGGTAHFTSSDGNATLPANSALTNGAGSFSATLRTAGNQTLTATDTAAGSITGTSGTIAVSPAAATHFTVGAPSSATAGMAFSFTVTALDAYNNTATGYGGTAHFTSSDGNATLPNNSALTNGTGSFNATLRTAGSQTLTATDTASSSVTGTSGAVQVSAAAATHFSVAAPPSATAGSPFSFTLTALDAFNNTATGYGGTVHFSSSDGAASLPPNGPLTNGGGTFSATLNAGGLQTLTATDTANAALTGTSNPINVSSAGIGFVVDDGSGQRSMVRSITLAFPGDVNPAGQVSVQQLKGGTFGAVLASRSFANGVTTAKFTFTGAGVLAGSLSDGRYLVLYRGQTVAKFHRLFGDFNGDARVDDADLAAFQKSYRSRVGMASYASAFDYNGDGRIDSTDYYQFLRRYKTRVNDDGSFSPIP